ncbi:MAG: DUF5682 family protein [Saprospiraceae bacterium]
MNTTIFGIRHHGPGSAQSLVQALEEMQPDCILVEGPADAQKAIEHKDFVNLKPPVAILVYNAKNLAQAAYFPFAEFSPEWQAIQFGLKNNIPVTLMDLPMERTFALSPLTPQGGTPSLDLLVAESPHPPISPSPHDPIAYIAQLAGYSDSERWWEVTFEQAANETSVFAIVLEMMTTLRDELDRPETNETLLREAHMRNAIRKAAANFQKIAVVCGAWHAPVLQRWEDFKKAADDKILKSLPNKISTEATWIPWSYERLAFQSGYSAGVIAPAWYELLFQNHAEATMLFLSKAAQLFRGQKYDTSAADVIEAIRLADTLATMRGMPIAGMNELREAALTVICRGESLMLEVIEKELLIGDAIGKVPEKLASPLQKDLEKQVKSARLTAAFNTTKTVEKTLDLRNESNLLASHLLHRLRILDIPWGELQPASTWQRGSFKEVWQLEWQAEFFLQLIEAGMWGSTVQEAATNFVIDKAKSENRLINLAALTEEVLNADLPNAVEPLVQQLQNVAALSTDVQYLMEALEPLVRILRYGNVRKTDALAVEKVVNQLIPRICIGLPITVVNVDDDLAAILLKQILNTNKALVLLNEANYSTLWQQSLIQLVQQVGTHELLRGVGTRLLFDKNIYNINITSNLLSYALSSAATPVAAAQWLEGFLQGSGLLLLHHPPLWQVLNDWVSELSKPHFANILPLLRRAFSNFTSGEREKILQKAAQPESASPTVEAPDYEVERALRVLPTVQLLLQ